jgi:arsenite-transporting ATPase
VPTAVSNLQKLTLTAHPKPPETSTQKNKPPKQRAGPQVVQFLRAPEFAHFDRIIFDTAPTGHTLRLLSLPDFLDASIGKVVRLRQKLTGAAAAVTSLFTGAPPAPDPAVLKLEELKSRMDEARRLFRDASTTEFVIVTIPTVMACAESARLAAALRAESVPVNTIVINQARAAWRSAAPTPPLLVRPPRPLLSGARTRMAWHGGSRRSCPRTRCASPAPLGARAQVLMPSATEKFLAQRRADQQRALGRLRADPGLASLQVIEGPLFDLEVRGVPALQYFGSVVWR